MKKNILYYLCAFLACPNIIWAQHSYDLRLIDPVLECQNHQFCATLQIKATETGDVFSIGSHTIFIDYNNDLLSQPTYESYTFDNNDTCFLGMATYMTPAFGYDDNTGEANLTTNMVFPNNGCPSVTDVWVSMGRFCFTLQNNDVNNDVNIGFNASYTIINQNNEQPEHVQGEFASLHFQPDCSGFNDDDNDGIVNVEEIALGTDPQNPDSDTDGLSDGQEVLTYQTNPLNPDSDNDMLGDLEEIIDYQTNPNDADSDNDQLSDYDEIMTHQSNPNQADSDGDSLPDAQELGENQQNLDTDNDNLFNINDPDDDNDGLPSLNEDTNQNGNLLDDDDDNDSIADYLDSDVIGTTSLLCIDIRCYPNPANNKIIIELPNNMTYNLRFFNALGETLLQTKVQQQFQMDTQHLPNAPYFIYLTDEQQRQDWSQKIIVWHKLQ